MTPTPAVGDERIATLERQLCRLRRRGALALLAIAALSAMGMRQQAGELATVQGGTFELLDGTGRVRASLALTQQGSPRLRLYDAGGEPRLTAGLQPGGAPALQLLGATGAVRVELGLQAGAGFVEISDDTGSVHRLP